MWLKNIKHFFIFSICLLAISSSFSQTDSTSFNKKRFATVIATEATLYTGTLVGLQRLWYNDYPQSSFHFFNDNTEWLQMDKVGHVMTSYSVGRVGIGLMKWSGVEPKKAIWYGGMLGSVFLTTVEMLDAYSSEWGFSVADLTANTAGSLLVIGQELLWDEQRIVLKYSFQQSRYSKYRPNMLGNNLQENLLKDYNGQTYWLSLNMSSFMKKETKFPKWLNVAVGYGADGMIGANSNPMIVDITGQEVISFQRYRQFYLSLDIDLTRIPTKSKFLKTVFNTIGFIKFPAPAIEFNKYAVKGNWLGF